MRSNSIGRLLLMIIVLSLATAGCVSMPSGGPVLPFAVTQGANGQAQRNMQIVPPSPGARWSPAQIVEGFLTASASFIGQQQVAREYLTSGASRGWKPDWSATVFTNGPTVLTQTQADTRPAKQDTASVTIGGSIQATLFSTGAYAVARPLTKGLTFRYDLVKVRGGQWRISDLHHNHLLLTPTEFSADYQLRNLYFFAPMSTNLVPDPVYVPLQAAQADLVNGLVRDLITQPPDWLASGATRTAFPKKTSLVGSVTVDGGTASVTLGGTAIRASDAVKGQIFSQLKWTLDGAGQGEQQVQSIALYFGSKAFVPPSAQGNAEVKYAPANSPHGGVFYYLGAGGLLMRVTSPADRPVTVARIGTGYTGLAVSPDGRYVAALRGGNVYTGKVGASKLTFRQVGTGFSSLSWDRTDYLWAAGSTGLVVVSAVVKTLGASAPVGIQPQQGGPPCGSDLGDVTEVRVAPDGVRIALVFGGQQQALAFGAIVIPGQNAAAQNRPLVGVQLSPFGVCGSLGDTFRALSWYGADDVIALSESGDTLTEYPVNGTQPDAAPDPAGHEVGLRLLRRLGRRPGRGAERRLDEHGHEHRRRVEPAEVHGPVPGVCGLAVPETPPDEGFLVARRQIHQAVAVQCDAWPLMSLLTIWLRRASVHAWHSPGSVVALGWSLRKRRAPVG